MGRTIRIFISSTFYDLKQIRIELDKFIETKFLLFCIFKIELDKYEIILKEYSDIFISINSLLGKEK